MITNNNAYKPAIHFGVLIIDRIDSPTFSYAPVAGLFDLERKLTKQEAQYLLSEAEVVYQDYLTTLHQDAA